MKTRKIFITQSLRILLMLMCMGIVSPWVFASGLFVENNSNASSIPLEGGWEKRQRILSAIIPFTASTDGHTLYLRNSSPNYDITIRVADYTGQSVIEIAVPKDASSYIAIPINLLSTGSYILEIRNRWGGYVYGNFTKDADNY